jgi:monovalent cation:H+ antiporter, CPA1 family
MERFFSTEIVIIELLIIGTLVAFAVRQLNLPYTVALVLVALAVMLPQSIEVDLTPEVLLALLIPPLVFDAAHRTDLRELRQNLTRILILAFPGVILSTVIVGGTLNLFTRLALPVAMVFGALISTTDPFVVGSLLRNLGVSKRLAILVEGESLLNNVVAILIFNLAINSVLTEQFHFLNSLAEFVLSLVGGVAVGLVLGWLISKLVQWGNDDLMETVLTALLAFGSYLVAERLHVSGVLAVIAAGLINGHLRPQGTIRGIWEYLALLANSLIFLLIGLEVNVSALLEAWQPVLSAILAILVARAVIVYGLNGLLQLRTDRVPTGWLHAWNWAGLRGAIGMTLVLSLPQEFNEYRELMIWMVLGVVLFSMLVQSTTLQELLRWLGLVTDSQKPPEQLEF